MIHRILEKDRATVLINTAAIRHNAHELKDLIGKECQLMAVVKANGYGHGAVESAFAAREGGATAFAVATAQEAFELRAAGITDAILILSIVPQAYEQEVVEAGIETVVTSLDQAERLAKYAAAAGKPHPVHVKLETGMHRLGFATDEATLNSLADCFSAHKDTLQFKGLMTHLACADMDERETTARQMAIFHRAKDRLQALGHVPLLTHVGNSATTLKFPEYRFDMVRVGLALYGIAPDTCGGIVDLRPAMAFQTHVTYIQTVPKGEGVGYGHAYHTATDRRIAVISVGYADGYLRSLGDHANVYINGELFPVVGRVCMDACMIDITEAKTIITSDTPVLLWGETEDGKLLIEQIAIAGGTIPYELTCNISPRVARQFIKNNEILR